MEWLFIIGIGLVSRLVPHLPNMTAVGGLALFSGSRFPLVKSVGIVFITMFLSDMIIGFHSVMWATYGCFFLTILLGRVIQSHRGWRWIGGMTLTSSMLFFLITNFAVWLSPNMMYPKTVAGLMDCYVAAIPFFRNSLLGDIFYTTVFFGGYEYAQLINKVWLKRSNVSKK